ncbi:MAG: RCC1 domain-containing protein [Thermoplasmatota archaeon]
MALTAATALLAAPVLGDFSLPSTPISFLARSVTGGDEFTCALATTASVWCWGDNREGELGQGTADSSANTIRHFAPTRVPLPNSTLQVKAGWEGAVCALLVTREVACWGALPSGVKPSPMIVPGLSDVVQLALGAKHACVLRADGTVWCWGDNGDGELGIGTLESSPTPVEARIQSVVEITAGYAFTCARQATGAVWCWGDNANGPEAGGQLGTGTAIPYAALPMQIALLRNATQVVAGAWHACAENASDGTLWCWGQNFWGQVGDGTVGNRLEPVRVLNPALAGWQGTNATWLALGRAHSCAGRSDGTLWCWGFGTYGQLGTGAWGTTGVDYFTTQPAQVIGGRFVDGGASDFATCGIRTSGALWCWGDNHFGAIGSPNPQQLILGSTCANVPSCTWSVPIPVLSGVKVATHQPVPTG